jgi:hypothetical protein
MISCETVGSGRGEHTDCAGSFRTGPRAQPTQVTIEGDNSYASDRGYPARLHSDGQTASVVSGKTVAYALSGMLALLGFVVFVGWLAVMWIVAVTIRRRLGRPWRPARWVGWTPFIAGAALVALGIIGWMVGVMLSF